MTASKPHIKRLIDKIAQDSLGTTLDSLLRHRDYYEKAEVSSLFIQLSDAVSSVPECVCGEINTRHCPVHGQDSKPSWVRGADGYWWQVMPCGCCAKRRASWRKFL